MPRPRGATAFWRQGAAGNSDVDVAQSVPANGPNVIAVATTSAGARAGFSNFGPGVDIAAPGQAILSTLNSGSTAAGSPGYAVYSGTSMAAPHVAGVVALMQSVALNPLSAASVEAMLKSTARALPVACPQGCGAGLVNADGAVAAVTASTTLTSDAARNALAAATGGSLYYQVTVPAGTRSLRVALPQALGTLRISECRLAPAHTHAARCTAASSRRHRRAAPAMRQRCHRPATPAAGRVARR
nr:S8 family serine peptidase [Xanthomonas arboricola]